MLRGSEFFPFFSQDCVCVQREAPMPSGWQEGGPRSSSSAPCAVPWAFAGLGVDVPISCSLYPVGSHCWHLWAILLAGPLLPQCDLSSSCLCWLLLPNGFLLLLMLPPFLSPSHLSSPPLVLIDYLLCARHCVRHLESMDKTEIPASLVPGFYFF